MESLKNFDFFGVQPNFKIIKKTRYQSYLGVVASTICFICILVTAFLFGRDFYLRETPRVVVESVLSNDYRSIILSKQNFTFAFRIEDENGNIYSNDLINSFLYFSEYTKNSNNEFDKTRYLTNITKRCDKIDELDLKFAKGRILEEFNCVDVDKIRFGGDWASDFVSFFQLEISNNPNIKNSSSLLGKLLLEKEIYISVFYQEYFFIPKDLDNALNMRFTNYFYRLVPSSGKRDRFFYRSYFLEDDLGWIFKESNSTNIVGLHHITPDFYSININHDADLNYQFYSYVLYYQSDYDKAYRSFMKIQELAALVGGFMKMVIAIMYFFMYFYNSFLMKLSLIKIFYDSDDALHLGRSNIGIVETRKTSFRLISNMKGKPSEKVRRSPGVKERGRGSQDINKEAGSIVPTNEVLKRSTQAFIKNDEEIHKEAVKKTQKNYNITFFKVLCSKCFYKTDPFMNKYIIEKQLLENKMDITYYLNLTNQFYYVKHMILDEPQIQALNLLSNRMTDKNNENLNVLNVMNVKEIDNIKTYFETKRKKNTLTDIDKILMGNMSIKQEQIAENI